MLQFIKRLIFAWRYKRAVKQAIKANKATGLKFYVIYMNGGLKVVPKKAMRQLIANRRFKKGVTIRDIEQSALFVTK